jgi:uncharacterized membrane protein HdeD (DUF308 family)
MATASSTEGLRSPAGLAKKITVWYIVMAAVFISLGTLAIIEPMVAAIAVAFLAGWLLVFGGVAHVVTAFGGGGTKQVLIHALIGLLYLAGGIYFLMHPLLAVGTLTLVLASVILAEGVLEVLAYFRTRKEGASGWLLLNAVITLLLGGLIWVHWPSSSEWAIGTLVGVNLLITGFSRLMFGLAARKAISRATA